MPILLPSLSRSSLKYSIYIFLLTAGIFSHAFAQPVTGFWKGKINHKNVEVKIIKNGDSLTGTSYYYESQNSYRRYSIKGYFNERDNSVVWWDDELIEEKKGKTILPVAASRAYISSADFNCPGGTKMYLDGAAALKENKEKNAGPVSLQKYDSPVFNDEWVFIIDNYMAGTNDRELIDSVGQIAFNKPVPQQTPGPNTEVKRQSEVAIAAQPKNPFYIPTGEENKNPGVIEMETAVAKPPPNAVESQVTNPFYIPPVAENQAAVVSEKEIEVAKPPAKNEEVRIPTSVYSTSVEKQQEIKSIPQVQTDTLIPVSAPTITDKFVARSKVIFKEIPLSGDSIEIRFYDNAEVDGDSISVFLNGVLLYEHIRLTEKAYVIKLAVADLQASNEMVMVAENLGSIPPNTSYMLALVDGRRYEARLESTEQSSAGIRFVKME